MSEQKKQEQQIENKSNKSQIIFAKEIVINFRFLLVTLGITLIFFIIYNFIFNPAKLGTNNDRVKYTAYGSIIVKGFGESKYDWDCQNLDDLDYHRKWAFREDITSKSLYCFFLSLSVLVLGRYIYKGINWVNNTYQKSNPNSIPKSDNSPQMNENNNYVEKIVVGIILIVSIIIVILITSNKFS